MRILRRSGRLGEGCPRPPPSPTWVTTRPLAHSPALPPDPTHAQPSIFAGHPARMQCAGNVCLRAATAEVGDLGECMRRSVFTIGVPQAHTRARTASGFAARPTGTNGASPG